MVRTSVRQGVVLGLVLLLVQAAACKKDDSRSAGPTALVAGEQTRPYLTVEDVKVRSGPGTRYKIIAEIRANTKVNVATREGGWLRVVSKQGRPPGYIDERFAKPMPAETAKNLDNLVGTYSTTADIPVRDGPGAHYRAVSKIPKDTLVTVVGAEGEWLRVESKHGNPPGYIDRRYAERTSG